MGIIQHHNKESTELSVRIAVDRYRQQEDEPDYIKLHHLLPLFAFTGLTYLATFLIFCLEFKKMTTKSISKGCKNMKNTTRKKVNELLKIPALKCYTHPAKCVGVVCLIALLLNVATLLALLIPGKYYGVVLALSPAYIENYDSL